MAGFFEITGLIGTLQTCLHAYRAVNSFIANIEEMGHDVADLETRVFKEENRLSIWGQIHNLLVDDPKTISTSVSKGWANAVCRELAIVNRNLTNIEEIATKYSPVVPKATAKPIAKPANETARLSQRFDLSSRLTDDPRVQRAETDYDDRSHSIQQQSLMKKAIWAMKDKEKLKGSVGALERCNNSLYDLTMPTFHILMYDALMSRFPLAPPENLNKIFFASSGAGKDRLAEEMEARTVAERLVLETEEQKLQRRLDISLFVDIQKGKFPDSDRPRLQTQMLDCGTKRDVLVEWKEYSTTEITTAEVNRRVSEIVGLLQSPPSFLRNVPRAIGYFEDNRSTDKGTSWIGVVYAAPEIQPPRGSHPTWTLEQLLRRPATSKNPRDPPEIPRQVLGDRFKLAHRLAETLLAVHNCGWFHKGLRSENILFFSGSEVSVIEPFIMGWEYSRRNAEGQKSENIRSWVLDSELYEHPDWLRNESVPSKDSSRFRKEYDQYQLGCLLLEIGQWRLLGDLKRSSTKNFEGEGWKDDWKEYLISQAKKMRRDVGVIYSDVVVTLLEGLVFENRKAEFWEAVVLALSKCNA